MGCSLSSLRGRRSQMMVEALEGRDCPTVTATLSEGTLLVAGDDGPNQVGITELTGAVVKINADGEGFPSFAGVKSIVIETFGGDDRVEFVGSLQVGSADTDLRRLDIDVGAGDDVMILRDPDPESDGAIGSQLFFQGKLRLGTGHDLVRAEVNRGSDVSLDVLSADGGDTVGLHVWQDPITGRTRVVPRKLVTNIDLGGGGNLVSLATGPAEELDVSVKTADRAGTAGPIAGDRYTLSLEGTARIGPFFEFKPARLKVAADLGDADDRMTIDARGFTDVSAAIATGAGSDTVIGKYRLLQPRPDGAPATLTFNARLGDGDDRLDARFAGYDTTALQLDFGTGNDWANTRVGTWIMDVSYERSVNVNAQLGAGDDFFRLLTRGYDEVRADLDTGPDRDGRDVVFATFVRPGAVRPRFVTFFDPADPMLDQLRLLAVGYPTVDVSLQGHEYVVFFSGGVP